MSEERTGRPKYNFLPNAMAAAINARWGVKRTGNIISKKSNPVKKRKTKESGMVFSTQAFPKLRTPKQRKTSKKETFVSLSQPDPSTRKYISKNWQPPLKSITTDKKDFEYKTSTMLEEKSENDNSIKAVSWTQNLKSSLLSEIPCSMPDPIMQNDSDDSFSEKLTQEYIPKNAEKSPPYLSQDMMEDESSVIDKITNNHQKLSQKTEQNYEIISSSLDKNADQILQNNVTFQKGINPENLLQLNITDQHILQISHDTNIRTEQTTQKQSIYNEDDDELIMSSQLTINSHLIPTTIPQSEKIIENSNININDKYNSLQEMTITNSLNRTSNNTHLDNESLQINVLNENKEETIRINFPQALQHLSEQSSHVDDIKNIVNKESPVIKDVKDNATDSNSNTSELISCISENDKNPTLNFTTKDLSQNLEIKTEEIMSCVMENSTRLTSNTENETEENTDITEKSDKENKELYSSQIICNSQSTEKINKENSQNDDPDQKIMQNIEENQRVNTQNTDKIISHSESMNNINNQCLPELIVNQNINYFSLQSKETNTSQQVISAYTSSTSVSVQDNPFESRDVNINESKITVNMLSNPSTVQSMITNQAMSLSVEDNTFVSRDANINKSKFTVNMVSNPNTVRSMINQDAPLQISNYSASNITDEQQTAQNNDTERPLKKNNQYSDSNVENSKITEPHNIFETLNNSITELEDKLKKFEYQKNVLQEINAAGTNIPQFTPKMNIKSNSAILKNQNGHPELEKNVDFTDTIQEKCLKKTDSKIDKEMPQENQSYNYRFEPHMQNKTLDQNLNFQERREEINLNSNENNPLTQQKQNAATTSEKHTRFHKTAEEKQSISVSNNSSEQSVSLKQISNAENVQIQFTLKQLKENNLNNLTERFCKSPIKANEAPNIQQEAWEQSMSNDNLLDDDLGITHSQLLRIEDECLLNAHNETAVPVDWMQKMVESREKLQAAILEIKRLNALITRVRREMWHP